MIRIFDVVLALIGLIVLSPFLLIITLLIRIDSKGNPFYLQKRIGKDGKPFVLYKFRTMVTNADYGGSLTIGCNDKRITKLGAFLRKYKIDELPQLINVLNGDMSFVGPRPEVEEYVKYYNEEQKAVLKVQPGITDLASLYFINESDILGNAKNPEHLYIKVIMPLKIILNLNYVNHPSLGNYFKIIFLTVHKIFHQHAQEPQPYNFFNGPDYSLN